MSPEISQLLWNFSYRILIHVQRHSLLTLITTQAKKKCQTFLCYGHDFSSLWFSLSSPALYIPYNHRTSSFSNVWYSCYTPRVFGTCNCAFYIVFGPGVQRIFTINVEKDYTALDLSQKALEMFYYYLQWFRFYPLAGIASVCNLPDFRNFSYRKCCRLRLHSFPHNS